MNNISYSSCSMCFEVLISKGKTRHRSSHVQNLKHNRFGKAFSAPRRCFGLLLEFYPPSCRVSRPRLHCQVPENTWLFGRGGTREGTSNSCHSRAVKNLSMSTAHLFLHQCKTSLTAAVDSCKPHIGGVFLNKFERPRSNDLERGVHGEHFKMLARPWHISKSNEVHS